MENLCGMAARVAEKINETRENSYFLCVLTAQSSLRSEKNKNKRKIHLKSFWKRLFLRHFLLFSLLAHMRQEMSLKAQQCGEMGMPSRVECKAKYT